MLSTVIYFSTLVKNAGGPSKVDSRFLPVWYGFFATLPLVTTLSLIIHLSFGNLFCSIWIMITNDISENLGLTQSDLVDYSQLVGKILI